MDFYKFVLLMAAVILIVFIIRMGGFQGIADRGYYVIDDIVKVLENEEFNVMESHEQPTDTFGANEAKNITVNGAPVTILEFYSGSYMRKSKKSLEEDIQKQREQQTDFSVTVDAPLSVTAKKRTLVSAHNFILILYGNDDFTIEQISKIISEL